MTLTWPWALLGLLLAAGATISVLRQGRVV